MMKKHPENSKQKVLSLTLLGAALLSLSLLQMPGFTRSISSTPSSETVRKKAVQFKNWALSTNLKKGQIHAFDAWKLQRGDRSVVVAVVDTGIDGSHPDLKPNLWSVQQNEQKDLSPVLPSLEDLRKRLSEISKTSSKKPIQRSSASESKTPVYGWNYVTNQPNPSDDHGHGTHVAGIIGAVTNSKSQSSGVSPVVSLMGVKYYSAKNSGEVNLQNTIRALHYAIDHGARIINYSGGGAQFSQAEFEAIKKAEKKGILVVAAAGNDGNNLDQDNKTYYPASYGLSNIISVAATNPDDELLSSSNFGKKTIDVAAPGERIYSTLPNGQYGYLTGTSQATAFVSGLAALMLAENPNLTPSEIKELIKQNIDSISGLKNKVSSGGRINVLKTLQAVRKQRKSLDTRVSYRR